ncbi:hypothetical protein [Shewanella livingstonensis]|uniref:Uncharacterized protein n=1 Tax=Shewanella livingstonensis TaxID=150120 RepID=A0A3G8M053_9GAMM|nr:hypothetical protein [Shewanella livingstonensis]AZG74785.1 hypothetical protein EGC82_19730 [Shewanella livingstonensis]
MFNRLSLFLYLILALSTSACAMPTGMSQAGSITAPSIDEASGFAVSRLNDNILWVHNDSGDTARIFAIDSQGHQLATVNITGVKNNDWEDIASFVYQGESYLLIADVGDNQAKRSQYQLHLIKEPDLSQLNGQKTLSAKPVWSMTFTYPDGSHDCESVAVDSVKGKILLLTKRDTLPILYELPLIAPALGHRASNNSSVQMVSKQAKKLGEIAPLPTAILDYASIYTWIGFAGKPTAMDISADGLSAVVLTYTHAFYFTQTETETGDWLTLFSTTPQQIALPAIKQAEAVGFSQDGQSIYITSETIPAPVYKMDLNSAGTPQ